MVDAALLAACCFVLLFLFLNWWRFSVFVIGQDRQTDQQKNRHGQESRLGVLKREGLLNCCANLKPIFETCSEYSTVEYWCTCTGIPPTPVRPRTNECRFVRDLAIQVLLQRYFIVLLILFLTE